MSGWPPPAPPPRRTGAVVAVVLGVLALLVAGVVVLAAVVYVALDDDGTDVGQEVFLEPLATAREPFTAPVGDDVAVAASAAATGSGGQLTSAAGGEPGLYGGTRDQQTCDRGRLVDFLESDPAKARAWAGVVGIDPSSIRAYVDRLTPVLLRRDTRVTNHGFRDGRATASPAVLQAGTAVLVDDRGRPVTKCYCGNPLTPPQPVAQRYTGPRWDGFDPGALTVVVDDDVVIQTFVLVDVHTNVTFVRPVGTDGGEDEDGPDGGTPPATSTSTPTTAPPGTAPPGDDALSGSYTFSAAVADGSDGSCVAYDGTLNATVEGSGDDRTVTFDAGDGVELTGPLGPDDSFDLTAPLVSGEGSQTLTGRFTVEESTITISGTGSVDSGDLLCNLTFTGQRMG